MGDRLDIIAIGSVAMDYYLVLETFSRDQEKIRARSAEFLPGGTIGNFACAAAKLGLKTGFAGVVGKDPWGRFLKGEFEKHGVEVSHLRMRTPVRTPITVLVLDDLGNRVNFLPPFPHLRVRDLDDSYLAKALVLHTHLFDPDVVLHLARVAEENKAIFSLDVELHRVKSLPGPQIDRLMALAGVLFLNRQTLEYLVPGSDIGRAARALRSRGPRTVVVTLGDEGSLAVNSREKVFRAPSLKVEALDATGAGDCFAAAFCYGYLKGWPLEKTLKHAAAASAGVVTRIGARTGQPGLAQFLALGDLFPARRKG